MAPSSLKKTIQSYKVAEQKIEGKLEQLRRKREELDSRAFTVVDENGRISERERQTLVDQDVYRTEVGSLVSTATDILLESLELQLMYIRDALQKLSLLYGESPRSLAPPELAFSHYEEWLETNQRLLELNTQLYDLEKLKFELRQKQVMVRRTLKKGKRVSLDDRSRVDSGSQFIQSSVLRIQAFLSRFRFPGPATTTQVYLTELLNPRGSKVTLECQKIQEYVAECLQCAAVVPEAAAAAEVKGGHPQRYHEFMGVLCNYIVQKQKESQGEELSYEQVFNIVERHLMPKIKSAVLPYISQLERDEQIVRQCERFASITLDQLRVNPALQSKELVPFMDSITQLRASYFTPNPTDKMYTVVAAAKALYDQLGLMKETSIDGDSFLDLWVYVILKANIKDLATNIMFMTEYGNPQLANDEAGYYLTTLEAAARFIEDLSSQKLKKLDVPTQFVVCEGQKFSELSTLPSSCFHVVNAGLQLEGYRVAVVTEWALNRARLFSSVLVPTGNSDDCATVATIRLMPEATSYAHIQYFTQCFEHLGVEGLYARDVGEHGCGVLVDTGLCDLQKLVILPSGDYDSHCSEIKHVIQLIRLGSQGREPGSDSCVLPSLTTATSSFVTAREELSILAVGAGGGRGESGKHPDAYFIRPLSASDNELTTSGLPRSVSNATRSPYLLDANHHLPFEEGLGARRTVETKSLDMATIGYPDHLGVSHHKPSASVGTTRFNSTSESTRAADVLSGRTITVEVELHEPGDLESEQFPLSMASPGEFAGIDTSRSRRAVTTDAAVEQGRAQGGGGGEEEGTSNAFAFVSPFASLPPNLGLFNHSNSTDVHQDASYSQEESLCPTVSHVAISSATVNILSREYVHELEQNFVENHLFGETPEVPLAQSVTMTIKRGQLYLQRLNYLSVALPIDGVYSDTVLEGVRKFQVSHNLYESKFSVVLPENGYLTATTFQYLRQAFLTSYASMLRLGLDEDLGGYFDPLSTKDTDVRQFRRCVEKFQRESKLSECQRGSLCANTIDMIKKTIRTQTHSIG